MSDISKQHFVDKTIWLAKQMTKKFNIMMN